MPPVPPGGGAEGRGLRPGQPEGAAERTDHPLGRDPLRLLPRRHGVGVAAAPGRQLGPAYGDPLPEVPEEPRKLRVLPPAALRRPAGLPRDGVLRRREPPALALREPEGPCPHHLEIRRSRTCAGRWHGSPSAVANGTTSRTGRKGRAAAQKKTQVTERLRRESHLPNNFFFTVQVRSTTLASAVLLIKEGVWGRSRPVNVLLQTHGTQPIALTEVCSCNAFAPFRRKTTSEKPWFIAHDDAVQWITKAVIPQH